MLHTVVREQIETFSARSARGGAPDATDHPALELLFDPQTSSGLLFAVSRDRSAGRVARLHGWATYTPS